MAPRKISLLLSLLVILFGGCGTGEFQFTGSYPMGPPGGNSPQDPSLTTQDSESDNSPGGGGSAQPGFGELGADTDGGTFGPPPKNPATDTLTAQSPPDESEQEGDGPEFVAHAWGVAPDDSTDPEEDDLEEEWDDPDSEAAEEEEDEDLAHDELGEETGDSLGEIF